MAASSLYRKDFYAWTQEQAGLIEELIKTKVIDNLDLKNLLEEVKSMGASEVRELERRLEILFMHLLKWKYQPNLRSNSWRYTIKEQRRRIALRLKKMPSLKSQIDDIFNESYEIAIYEAVKETGLDESLFPIKCEWTKEQILDMEFFPD